MKTTRRALLKSTAAMAASTAVPNLSRGASPNETVRVAIIGVRGKGRQHMQMFKAMAGVQVVALCDPDRQILAERAKELDDPKAKLHTDLRRVMDDPEIDAVVIATPNHWHALATVWACQAGKDVYVEKPVSYTIHESQQMIAAARKYGRIIQSGTQRRSDSALAEAFTAIRDGELGKIKQIRGCYYNVRNSIGKVDRAQAIPAHIDYDLWCGPAPRTPLMRKNLHYDWHWVWATGNGELGNNGPHVLDLARWAAGYETLAPGVASIGGRFGWNDDGETPNTHLIYYDYQPAPIIMEIRNLPMKKGMRTADNDKGIRIGLVIECEGGYFAGMDGGHLYDRDGKKIRQVVGDGGRSHQANFIAAVRSRKATDLNAEIAVGHLSCGLCHQGNIAHHLGEESTLANTQVRGGQAAGFERMAAHLDANEIDPLSATVRVGPALKFDTKAERFQDNEKANALLSRSYRAPFSLPDRI
ncbi:MAG: putative dehydrogenase [Candidatus Omnitrophota bacterium]|jgi:predicted dehydrogenase